MTKQIFKIALGLFLLFAGISHLTWARAEFLAQVPPWVPFFTPDFVVLASGVVEISLGLLLVFTPRTVPWLGWTVGLFFFLIWPGNFNQYIYRIDAFGLDTDLARFVRLFFQPVLIVWALWACGVKAPRRKFSP